jgi:hypothetical protein
MRHHTSTTTPSPTGATELTPAAWRALAHVRRRTITGTFACRPLNMPTSVRCGALAELAQAGDWIESTDGQIADAPTVTGGYSRRGRAARDSIARSGREVSR